MQWNFAKVDTTGIMRQGFVHCSKVSLAQGVIIVVDHAPLQLWLIMMNMIKKYLLMRRDLFLLGKSWKHGTLL